MTTTASGLQYEDTNVGTGDEAKPNHTCVMHYTGWLWIDGAKGSKFDSSLDRGDPFSFKLGTGQVIGGWDEGVAGVKIGGKRTLKIGDLMGTVVVPFKKLDTEEDYESLTEMAEEIIDFWAENGLEHERCGEMIERIGLVNFLEGIDVDVDPNMVSSPRQSSYVRMDGWDEEAEKWFERQSEKASA